MNVILHCHDMGPAYKPGMLVHKCLEKKFSCKFDYYDLHREPLGKMTSRVLEMFIGRCALMDIVVFEYPYVMVNGKPDYELLAQIAKRIKQEAPQIKIYATCGDQGKELPVHQHATLIYSIFEPIDTL